MKVIFNDFYWNTCYSPVFVNGLFSEHKTMCKTFKNMIAHELCDREIVETIKICVESHIAFEKSKYSKSQVFTNEFNQQ